MSSLPFNRYKVRLNRQRSARYNNEENFILGLGAKYLAERFDDIERNPTSILEIGGAHGQLKQLLLHRFPQADYIQTDLSFPLIRLNKGKRLVMDEEYLSFAPYSFDLIVSNLTLHWVNDLPGTLLQIRQCLKPNGLFIANMFGTLTLQELRQLFMEAELSLYQRSSSRISPFIDTKTGGALLQRAGFELPITDSDTLTISYSSLVKLIYDLRAAGQNSAFTIPAPPLGKKFFLKLCQDYTKKFPSTDDDSSIKATFEFIHLTGIQQKSL